MSSSNEPVRIKRELSSDDDDEIKPTVQSGTASSSFLYQPVKQEQLYESESKPIHQLEATFSFAGPVKQENVQVKLEDAASPVSYVFGHMAKCTLGNQCTTTNCSSIKAFANHLFDCARPDCSVCGPFQPQSNNPLPQISAQSIPVSQIHVPSPNIFQNTFSQAHTAQSSSSSQTNSTEQFDFLLNKLKNSRNNPNAYKATQQQVLNILNANPNLLDTFIERRQELQQLQQQSQSSINQSHNPLPQVYRQPVPSTQANVPSPNIPQPKWTFPPQISMPWPPSLSQSQAIKALQQLLSPLPNTNNNPQAQQQVLNILKSQPALMAAFIKQRQEQQRQQQLQHYQSSTNQSVNPLSQGSRQPVPAAQINPNIFQSGISQVSFTQPGVPGTQVNVPVPQSNTSQPQVSGLQPYGPMTSTEALKQLLTTLRNTNNDPQAQQQVLAILKSQPALMAAFIKQRQQHHQQQQLERQQQQHD